MRWATAAFVGFLSGALLALGEGLVILWKSELRFPSPAVELFTMELRYGGAVALIGLALAAILRRRSLATVAGATFGVGLALLLGWWVNKGLLDQSKFWEPKSLLASAGVVALSVALAFAFAWLGRRRARVATFAFLALVVVPPLLVRSGATAAEPPAREPAAAPAPPRPNLTLIVVDTLRADQLSCYGNGRRTSPVLDALAARGTRFEHCISQAPWTRPSMASLHSGLYPSSHGCNDLRDALPEQAWTIAEALHAQGYFTAGFSANDNVSPTFHFDQGFDVFWNTSVKDFARFTMYGQLRHFFLKRFLHIEAEDPKDDADLLTRHVVDWLDERAARRDGPLFTYVHYIDPHWPYEPPEFLLDETPPQVFPYHPSMQTMARFPFAVLPGMSPEGASSGLTYYDAEIRFCDRAIGRLLEKLASAGRLGPDDVVVVTADHGEQFYEHGSWGHGTSMFHEELRVPLIAAGGGVAAGKVVDATVRLFDVYPTLLELAGAPIPADCPALTLKPLLAGEEDSEPRPAFSERISGSWEARVTDAKQGAFNWETMTSLEIGGKKIIEMQDDERRGQLFYMSFDLDRNPREQLAVKAASEGHPLDRGDPCFTPDPALLRFLKEMQARARAHALEKAQVEVPEDQQQRLKAIGYGH